MKTLIAAIALTIALPAAAQTGGHSQHQGMDHSQHKGMDHGKEHRDCCEHKDAAGKPMECCAKAAKEGKKMPCCDKHEQAKDAHSGHNMKH
jgi:hypothetical protein